MRLQLRIAAKRQQSTALVVEFIGFDCQIAAALQVAVGIIYSAFGLQDKAAVIARDERADSVIQITGQQPQNAAALDPATAIVRLAAD